MREFGTQMERRFLWIDKRDDKPMVPKAYFTSQMWDARREEAALFIQRLFRGWLARRRVNNLRKKREE